MNTRVETRAARATFRFVAALFVGVCLCAAGAGIAWAEHAATASIEDGGTAPAKDAGAGPMGDAEMAVRVGEAETALSANDTGPFTLHEAIQRALLRAPSLTLARFDIEEAAIALQEAELGQLVGNPLRELEQARRDLRDKQDAFTDELVQLALQVEEAYHNVLSTADGLAIQQSNVEQAERQFALTKARFEAGLIPRQEFLEAELSREQSEHGLEAAQRRHEEARRQLNRLIGVEETAVVELRDEFPFELWHIDVEDALAEALSNRAEIVRAERAVAEARERVEQANTAFAAPVEARRAEMALGRAEIQLEQTVHQIASQVRTEWHGLTDARRDVEMAGRRETLAAGRVEISRARYDAGTISLLQLLQDEDAYAQARQDAVAAIWNYNLVRARFLRTLGRPELPPLPEPIAAYMEAWDRD